MDYVMLGVGLLLTVGTGLFVASEFALDAITVRKCTALESAAFVIVII